MLPRLMMFDLDGTLVDSRAGIIHTLRLTLEECGKPVDKDHDMSSLIGSSLWEIFEQYLETKETHVIEGAVAKYRHIYRDGPMFEYDIYPGIVDTLDTLQKDGVRLVLATAKAHEYAREVIETSPFKDLIAHVYGSELDGTNVQKPDLIRHVLREERISADQAVMVGDRHHDVNGARANGVAAIAAAYGYGQKEEFEKASAIVETPPEIVPAVVNLTVESR